MNNFTKAIAIVCVTVMVTLSTAGPARAAGIDGAAIVAAITALGQMILSQMFNPLNLNLMKTSAQATFQSEKIVATIAETARAQLAAQAQTTLQRDAAKIKEDMKLPPLACQTLASADAQQKAEDGGREIRDEALKALEKRQLGVVNTQAEIYALQSEIEKIEKQGVSVSATTLLGPTTYSATQAQASLAYIKSLVSPAPSEQLPKGISPDSPQAKAFKATLDQNRKALGLAENSLVTIYAARKEQLGAGKSAGLSNPNASQAEIAQSEVTKRSMNADYKKTIMTSYTSPLPVLKEIALTMGADLQIAQKQLQSLERTEALTAAHYAMAVRERGDDEIRRQREALMRSQALGNGRG